MRSAYTATAAREGRWWMVHVPEIDGLTQARRLAEVETMARELIAVTLNVSIDDVVVSVSVADVDGIDVADEVATIRGERAEAARLERDAAERAAALARSLVAKDLPLRDVGTILGVSYQRAHQLLSA
ncbi:MAG: hypothetical protein FWD11_04165 [Micrococcales bacterium]|nr:hypothetical protein [Micrococcales bacterium]